MSIAHSMRSAAREIFLHALSEASIEKAFDRQVHYQRGVLRVCDDLYDLKSYSRVVSIAFGKAAHRMAEILARQVGATVEGIIVDPNRHPYQLAGYRYFAGGHPLPNEESVRGAEAILKTLGALNPQSLVVYLISGGGSAAVEKPADSEITLPDLVATYKALVNSGAPIAQINAIRKHISAVKGGRMAHAANGAQQVSIMVSDVPENALDSLSSGPTMPDASTVEDCYRIAHLEAGSIGQRLALGATSIGLGSAGLAGFFDEEVRSLFGIDKTGWEVLYAVAIGHSVAVDPARLAAPLPPNL